MSLTFFLFLINDNLSNQDYTDAIDEGKHRREGEDGNKA